MNEILIHWEITEKEADVIADAIRSGLEDAAVRGAYVTLGIKHLILYTRGDKIITDSLTPSFVLLHLRYRGIY